MRDLFGKSHVRKSISINIYADEIFSKTCPLCGDNWFYIGLLVEDLSNPLLGDIIQERFKGNLDKSSKYYEKNNKIVHWSEIRSADTKNICKRWFEYILTPHESRKKIYSYILGINNSKLEKEKFDVKDEFNSKYNRFFRSAVLYALKTFFPNQKIFVKNIFHEEGTQRSHEFFPWHCIYKLKRKDDITFNCQIIKFLPKDHRKKKESNLIQLCDCILGASTSIIHGINESKNSKYREELAKIYYPLFSRVIYNSKNKTSRYSHYNRIIARFFPRVRVVFDNDYKCLNNNFFVKRKLFYEDDIYGQMSLKF